MKNPPLQLRVVTISSEMQTQENKVKLAGSLRMLGSFYIAWRFLSCLLYVRLGCMVNIKHRMNDSWAINLGYFDVRPSFKKQCHSGSLNPKKFTAVATLRFPPLTPLNRGLFNRLHRHRPELSFL
jgi:hypothetical protein